MSTQLAVAHGLSAVAFLAAAWIEGLLFFPNVLQPPPTADYCFVRSVTCTDDGRGVVHFSVAPTVETNVRSYLAIYDLTKQPRLVDVPDLGIIPWRTACSMESHHLFVASASGVLYSLDLDSHPLHARHLGKFTHLCPTLLECTADGKHVLVCGMNSAAVWNHSLKQCLWQRTDIDITYAAFSPDSKRLFCGLENGQVIEVELTTGETIRQIARHYSYCTGVTVSPQSDRVASIDSIGHVTMTDLGSGDVKWKKHYAVLLGGLPAVMPVCPRFSPSGNEIALICARRGSQVIVCEAATGSEVEVSHWDGGDIKGCAVGCDGTFYFWDDGGVISCWNRKSGELRHFSPLTDSVSRTRNRDELPQET